MKTQVTSLLLCALVCSTLGHDYLAAKKFAQETGQSRKLSPLSQFHERASGPAQVCEWVCPPIGGGGGGGLELVVNETIGLVGIVNKTAQVAIVIDITANLVGVFNGTSGEVVVVDIKTGSGIYITASQSTLVWLSAKESFHIYFSRLTSLKVFISLNVGVRFTITTISSAVLRVIGRILVKLSVQLQLRIEANLKAALTILISISSSLVGLLTGSLSGLLRLIGRVIVLQGDILWLVSVLEGLGSIISRITGGLATLLRLKIELDLALLLGAANGLEILINLLLAIVARADLSILGGLLNSVEDLLIVIAKLGGNLSSGVTGLLNVVVKIIALINGRVKIDAVIAALGEFAVAERVDIDISIYLEGLLKVIEIQESLHGSTSLSGLINLVKQLQNGKLIIGGINISEIITILIRGVAGGPVRLIVTILLRLSLIIQPVVSIPSLLLHLLGQLNSTEGIAFLRKAIPNIKIDVSISGNVNILAEILRGVNIQAIIKIILSGFDLNVILIRLPVIGQIYSCILTDVDAASNGSLSLKVILKASGSVIQEIRVWIQRVLHITIRLPPIPTIKLPPVYSATPSSSKATPAPSSSTSTQKSGGSRWSWSWSWGDKSHKEHGENEESGHHNEEPHEKHHQEHH